MAQNNVKFQDCEPTRKRPDSHLSLGEWSFYRGVFIIHMPQKGLKRGECHEKEWRVPSKKFRGKVQGKSSGHIKRAWTQITFKKIGTWKISIPYLPGFLFIKLKPEIRKKLGRVKTRRWGGAIASVMDLPKREVHIEGDKRVNRNITTRRTRKGLEADGCNERRGHLLKLQRGGTEIMIRGLRGMWEASRLFRNARAHLLSPQRYLKGPSRGEHSGWHERHT